MVALGMIALLAGFALGSRFRVMVLLPVQAVALLATCAAFGAGIATGQAASLGFLDFSVCLQVGYAIALVVPVLVKRSPSSNPLKA